MLVCVRLEPLLRANAFDITWSSKDVNKRGGVMFVNNNISKLG
jgi:hypothetical protein